MMFPNKLIPIVLCGLFAGSISAQVLKQEGMNRYPIQKIAKEETADLSKAKPSWSLNLVTGKGVHSPLPVDREAYDEGKEAADEKRKEADAGAFGLATGQTGDAKNVPDAPVQSTNFFGNVHELSPNDNALAVNDEGQLLSATNSMVYFFEDDGKLRGVRHFDSFYDSGNDLYDPRVTYDPETNRFVFVYLSGISPSTSEIVVCFSATNDPMGKWHCYTLPGNPFPDDFGSTWSDFPSIALNSKELFITVNLYDYLEYPQGTLVWQLSKEDGFEGKPAMNARPWAISGTDFFAIHPVQGSSKLYGPEMYFVHTKAANRFGSSRDVFLHKITTSLDQNPAFETYHHYADRSYELPPEAHQKGTGAHLDTHNNITRTAYHENGCIQFALNSSVNGKPGVYFGVISNLETPAKAKIKASTIAPKGYEIAFPAIAYGGQSDKNGNSTMMFFNYSSEYKYPGTGCIFIDTDGSVSEPLICGAGTTYVKVYESYFSAQRWGDYTGICPVPGAKGEIWAAGCYAYGEEHLNGTWISRIINPKDKGRAASHRVASSIFGLSDATTPSISRQKVHFEVKKEAIYSVSILDENGSLVKELAKDRIRKGPASLYFDTKMLEPGTYQIVVKSEKGKEIFKEELAVKG